MGKSKQTTLIKQREHNCIYTIYNRSNIANHITDSLSNQTLELVI